MTRMRVFGVVCLFGGMGLCASGQQPPATPAMPALPALPGAPAAAPAAATPAPVAPAPAAPAATPAPAAPAPATAPSAPAKPEPKGDVITLKNGRVIKNVQIIGKTPSEIKVQVTPDVSFAISRSQIDKIEEDGFDPRTGQTTTSAGESTQGSMLSGEKLSPEVFEKLSKPLAEPVAKYDNKDIAEVLADLSGKTGVPIIVDGSVMALPAKEREWTVAAKPGMSLMGLLQEELLSKFKKLTVVYQFDKLVIVTKEKANTPAAKSGEATPSTSAAPATPAAAAPVAPAAPAVAPAAPAAAPADTPAAPAAEAAKAPASADGQTTAAPRQRRRAASGN